MKIRSKRIAASIANQVSQVISSGVNDPRVASLTTINHVQLTPDLRTATIFVSVLGDKESQISDWGQNELTEKQIHYAANDVLYLHEIKVKLDTVDNFTKKNYFKKRSNI